MYQIKNLSPDDRKELEALYERSLKNNPDGFIQDISFHGNIYDRFVSYTDKGGFARVLVNDKKLIGMIGLNPHNSKQGELCKLHLNQDFQGQGLGKLLVEDLLNIAKDADFKEINLHVTVTQKPAIALYQKLGFVVLQQKECLVTVNDTVESYDTVFMNKIL